MRNTLLMLLVGISTAFGTSIGACLGGIAAALGCPLSEASFHWAIITGCWWGGFGAILLSIALLVVSPKRRLAVVVYGGMVWFLVVGFFYFMYVAAIASC